MKYTDRLTHRIEHFGKYLYSCKYDYSDCVQQLGKYEDFGMTPKELAQTLTEYELQKPRNQWDMDKIEKWQILLKNL